MNTLDIGLVICIVLNILVVVSGTFRSYSPFFVDASHWPICPNGEHGHSRCRPEFKYDCKQGYTCIKQHRLFEIDSAYCGICCRIPQTCPPGHLTGPACYTTPCPIGYTCNHGVCCLATQSVCPYGTRAVSKCKNYYGCRFGATCVHGTCCAGPKQVQVCPNDHYPLPGRRCNHNIRCPGTSVCYGNQCCQSKFKQPHPRNNAPPTFRRKLPPLLFVKPHRKSPDVPPRVVHRAPVDMEIIIHASVPEKPKARLPIVPPGQKVVSCPLGFRKLPELTCSHLSACPGTSECISGVCCSQSVISVCPVDHRLIPEINCNLRQRCPQGSQCVSGVCCIPPSCPDGLVLDPNLSCDLGTCAGHGTCISGSCCGVVTPPPSVTEPPPIIKLPRIPPVMPPRRLPVISTKAPILLTMAPLPAKTVPTLPGSTHELPTPAEPRIRILPKIPERQVIHSGQPNSFPVSPLDRISPNPTLHPISNPEATILFPSPSQNTQLHDLHTPFPETPITFPVASQNIPLPNVPERPMPNPNQRLRDQVPSTPITGTTVMSFLPPAIHSFPSVNSNLGSPNTPISSVPPPEVVHSSPRARVTPPAGSPVTNPPQSDMVPALPKFNVNISDFFPPNNPQFRFLGNMLPTATTSRPVASNPLPISGTKNPSQPTGTNIPANPNVPDWSRLIEALYPQLPTNPGTISGEMPASPSLPRTPIKDNVPSQPAGPAQGPGSANNPTLPDRPTPSSPSFPQNVPNIPNIPQFPKQSPDLFAPVGNQVTSLPSQPITPPGIPNIPFTFPNFAAFPPLFPDIPGSQLINTTVSPTLPNQPTALPDRQPILPTSAPTAPPKAPSVSLKTAPPLLPFEPMFNMTPNFSFPLIPDPLMDLFPTFPPSLPNPPTFSPTIPVGPPRGLPIDRPVEPPAGSTVQTPVVPLVKQPNMLPKLPPLPGTNPSPAKTPSVPTLLPPSVFKPINPAQGFVPSVTQSPTNMFPIGQEIKPATKSNPLPPVSPTTLPTFVVPSAPSNTPSNKPISPFIAPGQSVPNQPFVPTQPPVNVIPTPASPTLPGGPFNTIMPRPQPPVDMVPPIPPPPPPFDLPLVPILPTIPNIMPDKPQQTVPPVFPQLPSNTPMSPIFPGPAILPNFTMPPIFPGPAILPNFTMPPIFPGPAILPNFTMPPIFPGPAILPNFTMPPIFPGPAILPNFTMPPIFPAITPNFTIPPFILPKRNIPRPPPTLPSAHIPPPPPIIVPQLPPITAQTPPTVANQPIKIPPPPSFELPPPPPTVLPVEIPTVAPPSIPRPPLIPSPPPIFTFPDKRITFPDKRITPAVVNQTAPSTNNQTIQTPHSFTTQGFPNLPISLIDPTVSPFNFTMPPLSPLAPIIPPYVEPPAIPPATLAPVIPPGVPSPAGPTFPPFIATFNQTFNTTAQLPVLVNKSVTTPLIPPTGNQPIPPTGFPSVPAIPAFDITPPSLLPMTTPLPFDKPLFPADVTVPGDLFNLGTTQSASPLFPPLGGVDPAFNFTIPPLNVMFPPFSVTGAPTNFTMVPFNNTLPYYNNTMPYFNDTLPYYNDTLPYYNDTYYDTFLPFNDTYPSYYDPFPLLNDTFHLFNDTFGPVNNTVHSFNDTPTSYNGTFPYLNETFPSLNETFQPFHPPFPRFNDTLTPHNNTIPPFQGHLPPNNVTVPPIINTVPPPNYLVPPLIPTNPIWNNTKPTPQTPTIPIKTTLPPVNETFYFDNTTFPPFYDTPYNATFPPDNYTFFYNNSTSYYPISNGTTQSIVRGLPPISNHSIPTMLPPLIHNQTDGFPLVDHNTTLPPTLWVTLTPFNTFPVNTTGNPGNNTYLPTTVTSKYMFNLTLPPNMAPTTSNPVDSINSTNYPQFPPTDTPSQLTPPSIPTSCPAGNITIPGLYCDNVFRCPTGSSCYYGFCCLPYEMVQIPACLVDFVVTPVCPEPPEPDQCRYDRECGPFMTCCLNSCDRRVCRPTVNPKPSKPR